jgi:hypothetical protein
MNFSERIPSEADVIKAAAEKVPEFKQILDTLSDEEVLALDANMRTVGMGENCTLKGFPEMHARVKGNLDLEWNVFAAYVQEWQAVEPDPDPGRNIANEEASLSKKRIWIARKLAEMIDAA